MPLPFPGMDPWLEDPFTWSGFHAWFISEMANQLAESTRPRYTVRIEERVYVESDPQERFVVPDVRIFERDPDALTVAPGSATITEHITMVDPFAAEARETYVNIYDREDRSVVTVIELLSPTNKAAGTAGREMFLDKRLEVLASPSHWVEIDLLRDGLRSRMPRVPDSDYRVYISRATSRGVNRRATVWPILLDQPLPVVQIPLRSKEAVPLDLQGVLSTVARRGNYDLDVNRSRLPVPPLTPEQAAWAAERIAAAAAGG